MSYAVYTTKGWILSSAPSGEASKLFSLYTEDFGLIRARAQGVRLLKSKLRYGLEDYSFCVFSLVRGKEFWRVTGSEPFSLGKEDALMRARVLNLVRRLVQGEEKNEGLFQALSTLTLPGASEILVLSGILAALGYLDMSEVEGKSERETVAIINKALKETQL